jgi:hypothetical protein
MDWVCSWDEDTRNIGYTTKFWTKLLEKVHLQARERPGIEHLSAT